MPYKHISILVKLHLKYSKVPSPSNSSNFAMCRHSYPNKIPPFVRSPTASQDLAADPIPSRAAVKKCEAPTKNMGSGGGDLWPWDYLRDV